MQNDKGESIYHTGKLPFFPADFKQLTKPTEGFCAFVRLVQVREF